MDFQNLPYVLYLMKKPAFPKKMKDCPLKGSYGWKYR